MRRLLATAILLSAAAAPGQAFGPSHRLPTAQARTSVNARSFEGAWVGKIPDNEEFQVLLEVFDSAAELEDLTVKEDSKNEVSAIAVGTQLNLELAEQLASFKGRLHPDGAHIVGRWTQGDKESWLVFERLES